MRHHRFTILSAAGLTVALCLSACGRAPLVPDKPVGPSVWMQGSLLACTTKTTDPGGAQVSYQFDWGDNTQSDWSDFRDDGMSYWATHTYGAQGTYKVKARARNSRRRSGWSEELTINIGAGEGQVLWSFVYIDPEEGEDSADFSNNTFGLAPDGTAFIGCVDYGAVVARKPEGGRWTFTTPELDEFFAAPAVSESLVFIGGVNDSLYALRFNGNKKWSCYAGGVVYATASLGADGTVYAQNEDSCLVAIGLDGVLRWSFPTRGGYSSPVVGSDGTVYCANGEGEVFALDPTTGGLKWTQPYRMSSNAINASPALDRNRNVLYVADEAGLFVALNLDGTLSWQYAVGEEPSSPVIGVDGTVYICGGGRLWALDPATQNMKWQFVPPLAGTASTPAISADGYIYFLVMPGRKAGAMAGSDSLYAVDPSAENMRRWACALGDGMSDVVISAPKIDADGLIYIGDATRAWCVVGLAGPAESVWPQVHGDAQNSGRVR